MKYSATIQNYLLGTIVILLFLANILSLHFRIIGKIGSYLWIFSFIFLIILAISGIVALLKENKNGKYLLTSFSLLIIILIIVGNTLSSRNLSGEVTQEISCAITHFLHDTDAGFNSTCLFGYPVRQFYVPMLPSLLFGNSHFFLNLGGSLYFLTGISIFTAGLRKLFKHSPYSDLFISILLISIFHFSYFNFLMFNYEQAIFPFCFALLACGIFLLFTDKPSTKLLLLSAILLQYLIYSYTPSLALLGLSFLVLPYLFFTEKLSKFQKTLIVIILLITLTSFIFSLSSRSDINIFEKGRPKTAITQDLILGLQHFIFAFEGKPIATPILYFPLLLTIVLSLSLMFGEGLFVIALWILGVIIFAIISKGYTFYGIDYRFHRITLVIPIFLVLLGKIASHISIVKSEEAKRYVAITLYIFVLIAGLINVQLFLTTKKPNSHLTLIVWLKNHIPENLHSAPSHLFLSPSISPDLISLHDALTYFFPKMNASLLPNICDTTENTEKNVKVFLLISYADKNSSCYSGMITHYQYIGTFYTTTSSYIDLYTKL